MIESARIKAMGLKLEELDCEIYGDCLDDLKEIREDERAYKGPLDWHEERALRRKQKKEPRSQQNGRSESDKILNLLKSPNFDIKYINQINWESLIRNPNFKPEELPRDVQDAFWSWYAK